MSFIDLIRGHLFDHLFQADGGVRVASDRTQGVPHIRAHQIGCGHAASNFIVPSDTGLCTGMTFHRTAQVPIKCADIIPRHTKTHRVHDTDQFLGICISRPRSRPKGGIGLFELPTFHKITRFFDRRRKNRRPHQEQRKHYLTQTIASLFIATPVWASEPISLPTSLTAADFIQFDPKQAALGHKLFYDPILSGNQNISCAHCHHPDHGTGDGLSLGIGEGGQGLGPKRTAGQGEAQIRKRIPRNAPGLWNLAARDIHTMFHDGRLSISDRYENGFDSPAEEWLPTGFNSLLAAQAVFPLIAQFEMAGNPSENEIIGAVHDRIDKAWPIIAKRVRTSGTYGADFVEAFPRITSSEQVSVVDIANALAAFMAVEWTSFDSPYDQYLSGDRSALSDAQKRGMQLFFGSAGCAQCHSGPLLSDQKFYALGLPPFGPGRTRLFDPYARDVGRMGETDRIEDAYRFRTPMLRNVALTAPYGHNGAFPTLETMIRHHLDVEASLSNWSKDMANLPSVPWLAATDFIIWEDSREMHRQRQARDLDRTDLSAANVSDIIAFMHALTGTESVKNPVFGIPKDFRP